MAVRGRGAVGWEDAEGSLDNEPWKQTGARGRAHGDLKCGAARNLEPGGFYPPLRRRGPAERLFFIAGPGARHRRAGLGQAPCVSRWRPRGYPFTRYSYRGSLGPEERPPPRSGGPICGGRVRLWMRAITLCPQTAGPHRPAGWSKGRGIAGAQRRRRNHA